MVLDEIGDYLQAQGFGQLGVTLFKGQVPLDAPPPAMPDTLMGVVEVPGSPPMQVHSLIGPAIEQPHLQILVRGSAQGYAQARLLAEDAYIALGSVHNQALLGVLYLWILPLQSPFPLRWDERGRPILVFTIRCARVVDTV